MQMPKFVVFAGLLVFLGICGCVHTRDISNTPEYKPWIGKTVKLSYPSQYSIIAPKRGPYYILSGGERTGCRILGKAEGGDAVVIEAVKETKRIYLKGGLCSDVSLILSMSHPVDKTKRIKVRSELNYIQAFRYHFEHRFENEQLEQPPAATEENAELKE